MLVRQVGLPPMSTALRHEAESLIEQTMATLHPL
jgi:hypothetical protein